MAGFNLDLQSQIKQLTKVISLNKALYNAIEKAQNVGLKTIILERMYSANCLKSPAES